MSWSVCITVLFIDVQVGNHLGPVHCIVTVPSSRFSSPVRIALTCLALVIEVHGTETELVGKFVQNAGRQPNLLMNAAVHGQQGLVKLGLGGCLDEDGRGIIEIAGDRPLLVRGINDFRGIESSRSNLPWPAWTQSSTCLGPQSQPGSTAYEQHSFHNPV